MTNSAKIKTNGSRFAQAGVMLALREIRTALSEDPMITPERAAAIRKAVVADDSSYAFAVALELIELAPEVLREPSSSLPACCRAALFAIVERTDVVWSTLVTNGTLVLRETLWSSARNVLQCFEYGRLFDEDESTYAWWDEIETLVRAREDANQSESGRKGEGLSMKHERQRLKEAGRLDLEPVWTARRDAYAGYDIESFDVSSGSAKRIYIECKACKNSPLSFHLTPNEVKMASLRGNAYFIHLWNLAAESLVVITAEEIQPHLPDNKGDGRWLDVRIAWASSVP